MLNKEIGVTSKKKRLYEVILKYPLLGVGSKIVQATPGVGGYNLGGFVLSAYVSYGYM